MAMDTRSTIDASYALTTYHSDAASEDAEHNRRAIARLIELQNGNYVAFPVYAAHAILEDPAPEAIPGMVDYGYGLLAWQDSHIPMIDLFSLIYEAPMPSRAPRYALIIVYYDKDQCEEKYGAIGLSTLPVNVSVTNEDQCGLPVDSPFWCDIALSCFECYGKPVPIIDTTKLFNFRSSAPK